MSIYSDNLVKGLRQNTYVDFCNEYPYLKIQLLIRAVFFMTDILFWIMGLMLRRYFYVAHLQKMPVEGLHLYWKILTVKNMIL